MKDKQAVVCSDCGHPFVSAEEKCQNCGSLNKTLTISLDVPPLPKLMLKGNVKDKTFPSKHNRRVRFMTGDELSKNGKWIKLTRTENKDIDEYLEKVVDPETGKIIHECQEPLHQHRDHGSAKKGIVKQKDKKKLKMAYPRDIFNASSWSLSSLSSGNHSSLRTFNRQQ